MKAHSAHHAEGDGGLEFLEGSPRWNTDPYWRRMRIYGGRTGHIKVTLMEN